MAAGPADKLRIRPAKLEHGPDHEPGDSLFPGLVDFVQAQPAERFAVYLNRPPIVVDGGRLDQPAILPLKEGQPLKSLVALLPLDVGPQIVPKLLDSGNLGAGQVNLLVIEL